VITKSDINPLFCAKKDEWMNEWMNEWNQLRPRCHDVAFLQWGSNRLSLLSTHSRRNQRKRQDERQAVLEVRKGQKWREMLTRKKPESEIGEARRKCSNENFFLINSINSCFDKLINQKQKKERNKKKQCTNFKKTRLFEHK
jgi:hypothetical protein